MFTMACLEYMAMSTVVQPTTHFQKCNAEDPHPFSYQVVCVVFETAARVRFLVSLIARFAGSRIFVFAEFRNK